MLHSLRVATLAAIMLLAAVAGVHAQDRNGGRHREISGRHDAVGGFAAQAADQRGGVATSRQVLRRCVRETRAAPDVADPRLGGHQSGGAEADHVLHVLRPGLSLCERVLFQGVDLRAERARAGRLGARPLAIAARRHCVGALQCRTFARFDPELQLLHHQGHEDRSAGGPDQRHACRSSTCSWRARA